jgi:hypothetical protein
MDNWYKVSWRTHGTLSGEDMFDDVEEAQARYNEQLALSHRYVKLLRTSDGKHWQLIKWHYEQVEATKPRNYKGSSYVL